MRGHLEASAHRTVLSAPPESDDVAAVVDGVNGSGGITSQPATLHELFADASDASSLFDMLLA